LSGPEEPTDRPDHVPDDSAELADPADGTDQPLSGRDLARAALADAQRAARAIPKVGRDARRRAHNRRTNTRRGGYSGSGPDPRDPQPVGRVLAGMFEQREWATPLAEARVFADWAGLVGADIAAHCAPTSLTEGELRVTAESTAWATQLRLLGATLLAKLAAQLGPNVVHKIVVTGPVAPSWKHGLRSVRGARGPRDTYG
jgi:predicted nucleic acid-binding Zn ribbon protein